MPSNRFKLNSAEEAHALRELLKIARDVLTQTQDDQYTGTNVRAMCKRYARIADDLSKRIAAN